MSAIDTITNLIKAGTAFKDGWTSAKQADPSLTWESFITSSQFTTAYGKSQSILDTLLQPALDQALVDIRTKEAAILNGGSVTDLSVDKLTQYSALLDVENQLMSKYAANFSATAAWTQWLVDTALPDLIKVAGIVLPILL
jgi:hypothetical protein